MLKFLNRHRLASTTFTLALPLVALFSIPGSAGQADDNTPAQRLAAMQHVMGVTLDTTTAPQLSIDLPERFIVQPMELALTFS